MVSLLAQELNNFDYYYDNQIHIKKTNSTFEKIENIINHKNKKNDNSTKECSLNIHSFNPTKNSPPNQWQVRLMKRINSINSINNHCLLFPMQ
tara:strand:+ start:3029 stop:3307 length:279 start_codon:yes stop_codon:yes gene_type:complete